MTENEEHKNEHASSEEELDEIETEEEEEDFDEEEDEDENEDEDEDEWDEEPMHWEKYSDVIQLMSLLDADEENYHERLYALWDEEGWRDWVLFVHRNNIPDCDEELLVDYDIVNDESRLEEIEAGAPISEEEKNAFEKEWLEGLFDDREEGESECIKLVEVKNKIVALSMDGGYIASQGPVSVRGIFDSREEALKYLNMIGKCDRD